MSGNRISKSSPVRQIELAEALALFMTAGLEVTEAYRSARRLVLEGEAQIDILGGRRTYKVLIDDKGARIRFAKLPTREYYHLNRTSTLAELAWTAQKAWDSWLEGASAAGDSAALGSDEGRSAIAREGASTEGSILQLGLS